nr:AAA family ATPase [Microvirga brassicacearum]
MLELKGQNFAACGRNGTGKSGIVDAIEFALTGNISRLAGAGQAVFHSRRMVRTSTAATSPKRHRSFSMSPSPRWATKKLRSAAP